MNPFAALAQPVLSRPGMPLSHDKDPERIARGLRSAETKKAVAKANARFPAIANPWDMTGAECEAQRRASEGQSNDEIAEGMEVSIASAENYLRAAREKMQAKNKVHAAVLFDRHVRAGGVQ